MRTFGKPPSPKPWWKRAIKLFFKIVGLGEDPRYGGHDERMRKRRRKTKFDR
ncbi:MAG: hypothetical protein AAF597_11725 [Bacteroidota bacterium]